MDKMIYTRDALFVQLETCSVHAAITCVQMVGIAPFDEQNLNRSQFLAGASTSIPDHLRTTYIHHKVQPLFLLWHVHDI